MYCAFATSFLFIFCRLYLVTDVCLMGTGKISFFSVLPPPSCGVNSFVQEKPLILTTFTS